MYISVKNQRGFTLIELLVVIAIMSILLGVGTPVLFKAARIYRFKNQAVLIKGMMDEMRSAAVNNLAIQSAATAASSSACAAVSAQGYDTNFDGICGDTIPFAYVFEMIFNDDNDARLYLLRTYARFSTDSYFGADDFVISERSFSTAYDVTLEGTLFPLSTLPTYSPLAVKGRAFAFSFAPQDADAEIWRYKISSGMVSPQLHSVGVTVSSEDSVNDYALIIDRTSGVPYTVSEVDF